MSRDCCLSREGSGVRSLSAWVASTALLALISLLSVPAFAARVRSLNLEELAGRADRIFQGRCIQVRVGTDPDLGQVVTYVSFAPQASVKGNVHGRLTIKLLGNESATARPDEALEGLPRFQEGEEVVLLLYPDSARGLTSPVGFGQGKFKILRDKLGKASAVNGFANERLLEGLSKKAQDKLGSRAERFRGKSAIPPDDLMAMLKILGS
jgi:hypothetical protein